jgi:hypothetical protein
VAWLDRESAAGREHGPGIWAAEAEDQERPEPEELDDEDPGSLDPGPEGPAGRLFCQDGPADLLPPGSLLAHLTEQAVAGLDHLSDSELAGVLRATKRQVAREQYKQVLVTAEYGRRRQAAFQDAARRGVPVGCRPGGFPGEELAIELVTTRAEAGHRIDDALDLTARLPRTLAGMAAGQIDESRAGWIALYTRSLSLEDAARADEALAGDAPELRADQLARKAASVEMKLNPEAVRARKEHAKRDGQRVEARREASGNASLAGRELDTSDAMASKAYIDAVAVKLRNSGLVPGSLDRLRALAMTDLTQGRNPLDRIKPRPATTAIQPSGPSPATPARPPALVNLLIPAGTLLGWGTTPAQAGPWGLLDAEETRTIVGAAARHPRTRWCATLTAADGTALVHACARGPRPGLLDGLQPQPPPDQLTELLRRLNLTFTAITTGSCDHALAEDHYAPSRKLRHLVRSRTATCDAPGCQSPAANADLDHTTAWPDGPTCQCNLAPRCRTHHRAKQAPDWTVEQTGPGVTRWTLPSGRTHVTTPTKYET